MKTIKWLVLIFVLVGCNPISFGVIPANVSSFTQPNSIVLSTPTLPVLSTVSASATPITGKPTNTPDARIIPPFDHIVLIVLENRDYQEVVGSKDMPNLNSLAKKYVQLSEYYAIRHPSLPNYIALISGDTQNITNDCTDCFINQPSMADAIESAGKTWKTYQEDLPSPCFVGNAKPYYQKHDPFIYFDSIRLNSTRCVQSIVPLTQLSKDLASDHLPNFSFIMPNICNSGHDCSAQTSDLWVSNMVAKLQDSSSLGKNSLIIITYDEGSDHNTESCCGLGKKAGGHVFTVLISPLAKDGFNDPTPYSHYSLLKTILMSWKLPDMGNTSQLSTQPIVLPWK